MPLEKQESFLGSLVLSALDPPEQQRIRQPRNSTVREAPTSTIYGGQSAVASKGPTPTTYGGRSPVESKLGFNADGQEKVGTTQSNFVSRTGLFTFSPNGGILMEQNIEEAVAKAEEKRAEARRQKAESAVSKPQKKKKDVVQGFRHQYRAQQQARRAFRPPEKLKATGTTFGQHIAIDYGNGIDPKQKLPKAQRTSPKSKDHFRPGTAYSAESQEEDEGLRAPSEVFTTIPVLDLIHCGSKLLTQGVLKDLSEDVTEKTAPHLRNAILACNQHLSLHEPGPGQDEDEDRDRSVDPMEKVQTGLKFAQKQQHRWGQASTFMTQMDIGHREVNESNLRRDGSTRKSGMRGQKILRRDPAPHNFKDHDAPYILRKGWRPSSSESGRHGREFVNLNLVMHDQTIEKPKIITDMLVDDGTLLALSRNADQRSRMKPHRRGLKSEAYEGQSIPIHPSSATSTILVPDNYQRNPYINQSVHRGAYPSQAEILRLSGAALHDFGQTMIYDNESGADEDASHHDQNLTGHDQNPSHRNPHPDGRGEAGFSRRPSGIESTPWSEPYSRPHSRGNAILAASRSAEFRPEAHRPRTAESIEMWSDSSAVVNPLFLERCTPQELFVESTALITPTFNIINNDDDKHLNAGTPSRNTTVNKQINDDSAWDDYKHRRKQSASRSRPITPSRPTTPESFSFVPPRPPAVRPWSSSFSQKRTSVHRDSEHAVHGDDLELETQPTTRPQSPQSPGAHFENAMLALKLPLRSTPMPPHLSLLSPSSGAVSPSSVASSTIRQENALISPTSHNSTLEIHLPHGVYVPDLTTIEPGWKSNVPRSVSRAASPEPSSCERKAPKPIGRTTLEFMMLDDEGNTALSLASRARELSRSSSDETPEATLLRLSSSSDSMFEALKYHDRVNLNRPWTRESTGKLSPLPAAASNRQQDHAGLSTRGSKNTVPRNRVGRREISAGSGINDTRQPDKRNGRSVWSLGPQTQSPIPQGPIVPKPGRSVDSEAGSQTATGSASAARSFDMHARTRIQLRPTPDLYRLEPQVGPGSPGPDSLSSWTPRGGPRSPPFLLPASPAPSLTLS